jgi:hypothetical protein
MSDEHDSNNDEEMSTTTTIGEDWNWDQVQDVWERISSLHDHFKRTGIELPWTSRGSLFAAMQMFLLECGGSMSIAKAVMSDLLQLCGSYVAGQVLASMQLAWASQELEGQTLNPQERARLKGNIEMLEAEIGSSEVQALSAEELDTALKAQDAIAQTVNQVHEEFGPEATLRGLATILQQSELFASQGDTLEAKSSLLNLLHLMWPVALHNAQKLIQDATENLKDGPAETRPN